jgi:hypothetical protein
MLPLRVKQVSAHVSQLGCSNLCSLGKGHSLEDLKGLESHTFAPEHIWVQRKDPGFFVAQVFKS